MKKLIILQLLLINFSLFSFDKTGLEKYKNIYLEQIEILKNTLHKIETLNCELAYKGIKDLEKVYQKEGKLNELITIRGFLKDLAPLALLEMTEAKLPEVRVILTKLHEVNKVAKEKYALGVSKLQTKYNAALEKKVKLLTQENKLDEAIAFQEELNKVLITQKAFDAELKKKKADLTSKAPEETTPVPTQVAVKDINLGQGVILKLVYIPAGEFIMGSPENERHRVSHEKQFQVKISDAFWMGKFEVTQEQWKQIMRNNPSEYTGSKRPVESIKWGDCQKFIKKINLLNTGMRFDLPTEAQWEYACRAGTTTEFNTGDYRKIKSTAWHIHNSEGKKGTKAVGKLLANDWGLHDMHGNVWEICKGWYGPYPTMLQINPQGPRTGTKRVIRGGGWNIGVQPTMRSASRISIDNVALSYIGFRLVAVKR